jgi:hypothetical protein
LVVSFKGINEFLYGGLVEIRVVAVQLDGVFAATRVMYRNVPVTADGVPGLVLGNVNQAIGCWLLAVGYFLNNLFCAVGGVVIDDDDVERIGRTYFLREGAFYRVRYRARFLQGIITEAVTG